MRPAASSFPEATDRGGGEDFGHPPSGAKVNLVRPTPDPGSDAQEPNRVDWRSFSAGDYCSDQHFFQAMW
jgi:hypothetical protein